MCAAEFTYQCPLTKLGVKIAQPIRPPKQYVAVLESRLSKGYEMVVNKRKKAKEAEEATRELLASVVK